MHRAPQWTVLVAALTIASPAYANGSVALPEPSSLVLFGLGAAGLALGRRLAVKKKPKND